MEVAVVGACDEKRWLLLLPLLLLLRLLLLLPASLLQRLPTAAAAAGAADTLASGQPEAVGHRERTAIGPESKSKD